MKPSQILRQAAELISTPDKWTQRTNARNAMGDAVDIYDPTACKWCAIGAVGKVAPIAANQVRIRCHDHIHAAASGALISDYNDSHTHAEVLSAMIKAAELAAEAEGQ